MTDWKSKALAIVSHGDAGDLHDGKIYRLSGGRAFATNGTRALIINSFTGGSKDGGPDIDGG